MAYIFYSVTFLFLIAATVLFFTRNLWRPYAPPIPYLTAPGPIPDFLYDFSEYIQRRIDSLRYSQLPQHMSFAENAEAGLHSSNFNLAENIEAEDSRRGLDEEGKQEVYRVMKRRGVGFDEARRLVMESKFRREGVGSDGRPLDRKAVMFDR